ARLAVEAAVAALAAYGEGSRAAGAPAGAPAEPGAPNCAVGGSVAAGFMSQPHSSARVAAIGPDLLARWRDAVADDVAAEPLDATAPERPEIAYGTTVLAALATPDEVVLLQLGDGDVVRVTADGGSDRPLPVDPDLAGRVTTSLCQPDPLASLRIVVLDAADVALVWLGTDGFGVGRVDGEDWWRPVGAQLLAHVHAAGIDDVARRLPGWITEPADVGGDDVTVAVLAREA
ncbi:MAG TPA: protein phosphatase 2C domain-containing protein, partial [Nocardioides sp.]